VNNTEPHKKKQKKNEKKPGAKPGVREGLSAPVSYQNFACEKLLSVF